MSTANLPEWYSNLEAFDPQYPGDGFNHTFTLPPPAHHDPRAGFRVNCPCGGVLMMFGVVFREDGESEVIVCPTCRFWHSLLWRNPHASTSPNLTHRTGIHFQP